MKQSVNQIGEKTAAVCNCALETAVFCVVDAQSGRNTDTTGKEIYDTGMKIFRAKRHLMVDPKGLPRAIHSPRPMPGVDRRDEQGMSDGIHDLAVQVCDHAQALNGRTLLRPVRQIPAPRETANASFSADRGAGIATACRKTGSPVAFHLE